MWQPVVPGHINIGHTMENLLENEGIESTAATAGTEFSGEMWGIWSSWLTVGLETKFHYAN